LKIVAATPGESQVDNINMIMLSHNRISGRSDVGEGLLKVVKELVYVHSSQHYSNDYSHQSVLLTTYVEVIRELRNIRAVDAWMIEKKDELVWLEQYLQPDTTFSDRCESGRRDDALHHGAYDQQYSDSDLNGIHESDDDDDDDSRFEDRYTSGSHGVVLVEGAGISQVNGVYTCTGTWDNVDLFTKSDIWEGFNQTFSLFRCRLSDNTKRWYISIVPKSNNPGTSFDIDFYYQVATGNAREVPGMLNWVSARGSEADPPPIVKYQSDVVPSDHDSVEECDQ
jgi:ubiquitin carboxyl-terminal hydrolase 9/24